MSDPTSMPGWLRMARHRLRKAGKLPTANPAPPLLRKPVGTQREPLRATEPSFTGPRRIQIAPGVRWGVPRRSRVYTPATCRYGGRYVLTPDGALHLLRVGPGGTVQEVNIPAELLPKLWSKLAIPGNPPRP